MKDNTTIKQNFNRVDLSPFVNANSTSKTYLSFFIALIPQLILLFTTKSFNNIIIIITAIFACNAADFFNYIEKVLQNKKKPLYLHSETDKRLRNA